MPGRPRSRSDRMADRQRVGFGGVVGIDGVEVVRHQKGRAVAAGRQQQRGRALAERLAVEPRRSPRLAQADMGWRFVRPEGPE